LPFGAFGSFEHGVVHAVPSEGEDEHPLAAVRSADFRRAEYSAVHFETKATQVGEDLVEPESEVVADVFEPDEGGLGLFDDAADLRPEMAGIVLAGEVPGDAEGLAGIARKDAIHDSAPRAAVKGCKVTPDRSLSQGALSHARDQDSGCERFVFHEANCSSLSHGEAPSKIKTPDASAKRKSSESGT
jgi:hypothetical protein